MKTRVCSDCGRTEGLKPYLSFRRNYTVVLRLVYGRLLCQWCRAKMKNAERR